MVLVGVCGVWVGEIESITRPTDRLHTAGTHRWKRCHLSTAESVKCSCTLMLMWLRCCRLPPVPTRERGGGEEVWSPAVEEKALRRLPMLAERRMPLLLVGPGECDGRGGGGCCCCMVVGRPWRGFGRALGDNGQGLGLANRFRRGRPPSSCWPALSLIVVCVVTWSAKSTLGSTQ